jgi:hypothetical protein
MSDLKIFISHSSHDEDLVRALVSLLQQALHLPSRSIRCTSVDGFRLAGGDNIDETIRREVFDARCVIAVLTPQSVKSFYVLFELGARWGSTQPGTAGVFKILIGRNLDVNQVGAPLRNLAFLDGANFKQLHQLIAELADSLGIEQERPEMLDEACNRVASLAANSEQIPSARLRSVCFEMAEKYDDFNLAPAFGGFTNDFIAVLDGSSDYSVDYGMAITSDGIVFRNPGSPTDKRLSWAQLKTSEIITRGQKKVVIGENTIDLSKADVSSTALTKLLNTILGRSPQPAKRKARKRLRWRY